MTIQSKLIEIVRELEQELQELRIENGILSKRNSILEAELKEKPKTVTVSMPEPQVEGWTYYIDQPKYEPVTMGSNCAKCGIKLDGVMGYVCPNYGCPTGLAGPKVTMNT